MQGIELRHLRCLVAIAEEGSFSRAALRLGTTQPAISQLLKRLEDLLGQRLLHRDRHAIALTPVGEAVLAQAREALAAVEGALDTTLRTLRGEAGRLRLGLSVPSLYGGVPALIRRFRAARPGVEVDMQVLSSPDQPAALRERRIDAAFGGALPDAPDIARKVLADEVMQVLLPIWHPLAGAPALPLAALREEKWILPPLPMPLREEITLHCRAAGFTPRIAAEAPDFLATCGLVLAGAGIALAAESARGFAGPDLILAPLEGAGPRLIHAMIWREADPSPLVRRLVEMV
ncbi:LysR family transcriptional regulator [Roseomonas sp. GC11]|uniref:LysR substrate-binding domain-containing protein n=1 Tax=Roseomonas sp. GC11 TaxID=2950546 RepID=UPI00210BA962|nr:LysR family transcriptional regulator [Roseomonas sp. GC11]MCQ4160041.1 LysR family transcriptional regulator [Roseomonas sp. GC11]